jgi:hypothetical protein
MRKQIKHIPQSMARAARNQGILPLQIEHERDVGGVGMGVLSDGTPFLTQRGLAVLCGVQNAHIGTISLDWSQSSTRPRIVTIKRLLKEQGAEVTSPHITITHKGRTVYAYPDTVCLAVLEYYAYEAGAQIQPEALKNFRRLAGRSLRELIYREVGYKPDPYIPLAWQQFHDRVTLLHGAVPPGYFSVFKELADLIVALIREGANFGPEFVPDISVGAHWGQHWSEIDGDNRFGIRRRYPHSYPDYFPQSATNPQPAFCYPDAALGEYRRWMREVYLVEKLPPYLKNAERKGKLPPMFTEAALRAVGHSQTKAVR